jgi:hypothetical protein
MNVIKTGNKVGQSIAFVRLIVTILIACVMCIVSGYMFTRKPKYGETTEGKITSASCEEYQNMGKNGKKVEYGCQLTFSFEVEGTEYTGSKFVMSGNKYMVDEMVTVSYNPENPDLNDINVPPVKLIAKGLAFAACVIVTISGVIYYITKNVKGAGTAYTAVSILDAIKPNSD